MYGQLDMIGHAQPDLCSSGPTTRHGTFAIEQLRCHCECTGLLDDTRDARWISLISTTMKHAVLIRRIMLR